MSLYITIRTGHDLFARSQEPAELLYEALMHAADMIDEDASSAINKPIKYAAHDAPIGHISLNGPSLFAQSGHPMFLIAIEDIVVVPGWKDEYTSIIRSAANNVRSGVFVFALFDSKNQIVGESVSYINPPSQSRTPFPPMAAHSGHESDRDANHERASQ